MLQHEAHGGVASSFDIPARPRRIRIVQPCDIDKELGETAGRAMELAPKLSDRSAGIILTTVVAVYLSRYFVQHG